MAPPNNQKSFNEQLRSIQQGIAAQFGGGGPQSSSEPDELFSPNESEEEQDDSKTQIAECGEQEQNAIEIKSEGEESGGDDFRRRAPPRQMASGLHIDDLRYANAEDAEMNQHDDGEGEIFTAGDGMSHFESSFQAFPAQGTPHVHKRSRSGLSSNGDAARPNKQIRSMEYDLYNPHESNVARYLGGKGHLTAHHAAIKEETIHTLRAKINQTEAELAQKTKQNIDLKARLDISNPQASLDAITLRNQLKQLSDQGRARELLVQEYLSQCQRAEDDASALKAQLKDMSRQLKESQKMIDAMRKKQERDGKALERMTTEHGIMLNAATRLFGIEGMRNMASEEFGEAGEALDELLQVVMAQRKAR